MKIDFDRTVGYKCEKYEQRAKELFCEKFDKLCKQIPPLRQLSLHRVYRRSATYNCSVLSLFCEFSQIHDSSNFHGICFEFLDQLSWLVCVVLLYLWYKIPAVFGVNENTKNQIRYLISKVSRRHSKRRIFFPYCSYEIYYNTHIINITCNTVL